MRTAGGPVADQRDAACLRGIAKVGDHIVMLLELEALFRESGSQDRAAARAA